VNQWIVIATILFQGGSVEDLPGAQRFDDLVTCNNHGAEMLIAYDMMIAQEQTLAERRCAGSYARGRCSDEEFRQAVPWILLSNPHCSEVPTQ